MLDKNAILLKAKIPTGEADFLGDKVKVRGLSVGEQIDIVGDGASKASLIKKFIPVCAAGMIDADGRSMFTTAELSELGLKFDDLNTVFDKIITLTGLASGTDEALEKN